MSFEDRAKQSANLAKPSLHAKEMSAVGFRQTSQIYAGLFLFYYFNFNVFMKIYW
jgi:hypothetical protein